MDVSTDFNHPADHFPLQDFFALGGTPNAFMPPSAQSLESHCGLNYIERAGKTLPNNPTQLKVCGKVSLPATLIDLTRGTVESSATTTAVQKNRSVLAESTLKWN
jgi:hypothetical protein